MAHGGKLTAVRTIAFDGRALASPAGGVRRYVTELFGALAAAHPEVRWVGIGAPCMHDVSDARHPEWYPGDLDPLRRWFYRRSATSAARIVTDSTFSRDEIVAAYGVDAARIHVVPLAAGPGFIPGPSGTIRTPTVLHVGDLHPRRNLSMLLDVVIALRRSHPALARLVLRLIGTDRGIASALTTQAAGAGHADALQVDGVIAESALVQAYQTATVLAYPSQYEGFGLPLLEAMACGTPVVASRAASMPEVVGDAGILVAPTDRQAWFTHLRRVCTDMAVARTMTDAGYTRAATFTWARTADLTFAVYRSL